jgi:hypothetical protein
MKSHIGLIGLILLLCSILYGKESALVTVAIDTVKVYTEDTSLKDAKSDLLKLARQSALEKAIPSNMSITSLTTSMYAENNNAFDEEIAKSVFINSTMAGYFLNEKIVWSSPDYRNNLITLRIKYSVDIKPRHDDQFRADLINLELSDTYVKDGTDLTIRVIPETDGYLYLFDFLSDNSVVLIYPNLIDRANQVTQDKPKQLVVTAVKGIDDKAAVTVETIYAVFSKTELVGWERFQIQDSKDNIIFSAGEESFQLFQKWLSQIHPLESDEKMVQIHIIN